MWRYQAVCSICEKPSSICFFCHYSQIHSIQHQKYFNLNETSLELQLLSRHQTPHTGSNASGQRQERWAGSILVPPAPQRGPPQQTPATLPLRASVCSHFLPCWLHHAVLLLHVSDSETQTQTFMSSDETHPYKPQWLDRSRFVTICTWSCTHRGVSPRKRFRWLRFIQQLLNYKCLSNKYWIFSSLQIEKDGTEEKWVIPLICKWRYSIRTVGNWSSGARNVYGKVNKGE